MMRLANGVEIRHEFVRGYDGPDTNIVTVSYKDKLLVTRSLTSAFDAGRLFEELRADWSHRYPSTLEELAAAAPK